MSIFSKVFLAIGTFIANLWNSTKSEWNKLSPEVQADFTKVIDWGNLIKGYVLNPSTIPVGGLSFLVTALEAAIGPVYMAVINSALNEALLDAALIKEAVTDPADAYKALLAHLATFAPGSVGDQIGIWVARIVGKIVSSSLAITIDKIKGIIAFVYEEITGKSTGTAPVVTTTAPANTPVIGASTTNDIVDKSSLLATNEPISGNTYPGNTGTQETPPASPPAQTEG